MTRANVKKLLLCAALLLVGCRQNPSAPADGVAGESGVLFADPVDESYVGDYSNPDRWVSVGGVSKGADIFLAVPTANFSASDGDYANFDIAKAGAASWQRGVEGLFRDVTNIYHPVYRYARIGVGDMNGLSTRDIIAAFDYYWQNYNKGDRPFILFGFSQGAYVLWNVLLEYIDKNPEVQKYHIATYALGSPGRGRGSIQNSVRDKYFSHSATDLNKIICFAPYHESDDLSGGAPYAARGGSPDRYPYITNPISWTTDDEYYACSNCASNVFGARVDYAKGVLIVNTTEDPRGSWGYHGSETTFFANPIKQNIIDRIAAWNAEYKNDNSSIRERERIDR